MSTPTESSFLVSVAYIAGSIASACFIVQYFPQSWLNYQRQSTKGFSFLSISIKLIGASFLMVNALLTGETLPVVIYGIFNVFQHCVFIYQFAFYNKQPKIFLAYLIPLFAFLLSSAFPGSMGLTNTFKPMSQVFSHIPQLLVCWNLKSTRGVSLTTQHLNMIGGVLGIFMCYIIPPINSSTWFMYLNSIFQAGSLYFLALKFSDPIFSYVTRLPLQSKSKL